MKKELKREAILPVTLADSPAEVLMKKELKQK